MVYWKAEKKLNNGKYIVKDILGSGGFGITYKITEAQTNKLFCLKTLNIEAQNKPDFDKLQTKFINEAIALASCPHPNIVKIYPQLFQEDGLWCMVMEYVEGIDLARYINQNGKLDEEKAIAIISKIGKALTSIHQKGFLHRDIKPANILLRNSNSEPVLIDFGLARKFVFEQSISMTNSRTESFAPIEQYQRRGKFGAWTDVYALAATLYNLLTARLPLPAKYRLQTEYDLTPPKRCESNISDRTNEAILKGMAIEPSDRPQTIEEWLKLLEISPKKVEGKSAKKHKKRKLFIQKKKNNINNLFSPIYVLYAILIAIINIADCTVYEYRCRFSLLSVSSWLFLVGLSYWNSILGIRLYTMWIDGFIKKFPLKSPLKIKIGAAIILPLVYTVLTQTQFINIYSFIVLLILSLSIFYLTEFLYYVD